MWIRIVGNQMQISVYQGAEPRRRTKRVDVGAEIEKFPVHAGFRPKFVDIAAVLKLRQVSDGFRLSQTRLRGKEKIRK